MYFRLANIFSLLKGEEFALLDRYAFYVCVGVSCGFRLLNNLTDFHEIWCEYSRENLGLVRMYVLMYVYMYVHMYVCVYKQTRCTKSCE